ncbi:hypothetical protein [Nitrospina gracilis]|uniref:hypothetical protein n=1 Tax=Nitrospina gracilis TaxID=35801 RepID=UPI001F466FB6|nr:hypothetical protein [Nitrospina gracilis]MCF8721187.1 hypothetical protein [Nitrospina gracilis Nb-211]
MNIIDIDFEKGIVQSDFKTWTIVSNDNNQYLLLQREENGRYHVAEADVMKKHLWEVKEINYRDPEGGTFVFDEDSGITHIA